MLDNVEAPLSDKLPKPISLRMQWSKSHKLSPLQLLVSLQERMAEEPKVLYDHLAMYRNS